MSHTNAAPRAGRARSAAPAAGASSRAADTAAHADTEPARHLPNAGRAAGVDAQADALADAQADPLAAASADAYADASANASANASSDTAAKASAATVDDAPVQPAGAARKRGLAAVDERIYRAVVDAVMSQRLPPGTRLGEVEFGALYDVSRTTVRQALQRLAHDHIVELRPNRGAVVASPTPREARDVFAARRTLERDIVPLVIRNATPAALRSLRAALEREDAARAKGDRPAWIRRGGEFHLLLAELGGNAVLLRFLHELVSRCSLIVALYDNPNVPISARDDHRMLLALIEQKALAPAVALIDRHLLDMEARLQLGTPHRKVDLAAALQWR